MRRTVEPEFKADSKFGMTLDELAEVVAQARGEGVDGGSVPKVVTTNSLTSPRIRSLTFPDVAGNED